ncbi:DUF2515 family protein [Sporosarcina sp. JAI121]|uniref:DUF2515 family protein n=1 Tax=Sporosarcina sp. JAI121 TaxID=2723064 RepID=UPI0017F09CCC|nr:DUF2515 family protein [Sporosarcina sp. JAI121]NYF24863.1 hypothetical protein [Sporosarcina sp. JAI121]
MLNLLRIIGGKLQLPENLLLIKAKLKNYESVSIPEEQYLSWGDQELLRKIRLKTKQLNVNNVTRTKAYLDFYIFRPEIHWAFLGHMVSRNGGWNMTDLKGEFLSKLMDEQSIEDFYSFLERGNWLIFQDAYPQFLLYEESLFQSRNLFYLLSYLNVSAFMEVIWNHFWEESDSYILAIALIINEQSYLEKRIVQNPIYKKKVFQTFEFVLQDLLSFNQILFPFTRNGHSTEKASLTGLTLHHFGSLHERIRLGKDLYQLLFNDAELLEKAYRWATIHPHTGSRKDYWPDVFNDVHEGVPGMALTRRLKYCQLRKGALRLYSPKLEFAWKNVIQSSVERGDWFEHWRIINYLIEEKNLVNGKVEGEYCETLEKLEIAAIAKTAIFA